jgi:eukaryotic-like serine/threonine-protein kinase
MTTPAEWVRVRELFHATVERPAAERSAFLDAACGQDQLLRQEVEALLDAHAASAGFLEAPAVGAVAVTDADVPTRFPPGALLGTFQILSTLGSGGMGEVYRARDTRLQRDVAIKLLPAAVSSHPERLARFERESQALAALNHPHIAAIHSIERVDGVTALILELVEGPTLAEHIASGPPSLDEALSIGRDLAEALAAAHDKGIVHRDLKPANVKITPAGTLKLLDFGLAKRDRSVGPGEPTSPARHATGDTGEGLIVGTGAYMSPEQARGKTVDKRTDIWAFGCVLYEMLTGRKAFSGHTLSDTVAAILEREPDWTLLPPAVPPSIRRLLTRCLEKDTRHRLHDIADARLDIEDALERARRPRRISRGAAIVVP